MQQNVILRYRYNADDTQFQIDGAVVFDNDFGELTDEDLNLMSMYIEGVSFIPANFGMDDLSIFVPGNHVMAQLHMHTIEETPLNFVAAPATAELSLSEFMDKILSPENGSMLPQQATEVANVPTATQTCGTLTSYSFNWS